MLLNSTLLIVIWLLLRSIKELKFLIEESLNSTTVYYKFLIKNIANYCIPSLLSMFKFLI